MELMKPEQINKARKSQTMELIAKNTRLISSMKKVLALQNDIEFDAEKAKKVKDYQLWCEEIQTKMSKELQTLGAYEKLVDEKKEDYYNLVAKLDEVEDKIADKKEELGRLQMQVDFKSKLLKQHA